MFNQIIDANVNRVCEGLRVVEEYTRFVRSNKPLTQRISKCRKSIHSIFPQNPGLLLCRDTELDARAKELPYRRVDILDILTANFKRAQEALRVLEEYTGEALCNSLRYDLYDLERDVLLLTQKPDIQKGYYLISDSVDTLKQGIDWKCSIVQLRDKSASKEEIYNKAKEISLFAKKNNALFILNDYIDIAILLDVDGVHTGQDDISVKYQKKLFGDHKLFGRTTHSVDQGLVAQDEGADYVSVGPIWETPSKPGRKGIGFEYLSQATKALDIPFVAIGGIDDSNIHRLMEFSPPLIGVVRAFDNIPKWNKRYKKV